MVARRPLPLVLFLLAPSPAVADATVPAAGSTSGGFWQVRCAAELQRASEETRFLAQGNSGRARPFMHHRAPPGQKGPYVAEEHVDFSSLGLKVTVEASRQLDQWTSGTTDEGATVFLHANGHRKAILQFDRDVTRDVVLVEAWMRAADHCLAADDTAPPPAGRLAGRWQTHSVIESETCPSRIYMQAREFEIDPTEHWIRWDVGEGSEEIVHKTRDGFDARDTFAPWSSSDACPGTRAEDEWHVSLDRYGALVGTDTASWYLLPDCQKKCTTVFRERATRR